MKKTKEMKGITLVALVITVIILLILATISIQTLTNTGLFGKAKEATKKYSEAEEKEKIQMELYYAQINKSTNGTSTNQIGEQLYDKNVENGSKWHIIVINDSKKIYGTGWTYIPRGSTISDTKTNETWLINNSSQEIIKLEDGTFTDLSYKTAVGTTDGLILNLDPSVIENATKENINEKLGSNVELMNFDWNEDSGLTKKSFNFDGVNDYIKIKYDNEEEKNILAQNGFTFEFYGTYNGGTSYNEKNEVVDNNDYKGFFCYWNGNEKEQAALRFGINNYGKNIFWNAKVGIIGVDALKSDYSHPKAPWNIIYPETEKIQSNKEVYFTITLNCTQNNYIHTLYANGEKLYEGNFNNIYWNNFVKDDLQKLKYFCIGRSSMDCNGSWHYSKMNAYSIKLYNRGLSAEEVKDNYNKAVAYHNAL